MGMNLNSLYSPVIFFLNFSSKRKYYSTSCYTNDAVINLQPQMFVKLKMYVCSFIDCEERDNDEMSSLLRQQPRRIFYPTRASFPNPTVSGILLRLHVWMQRNPYENQVLYFSGFCGAWIVIAVNRQRCSPFLFLTQAFIVSVSHMLVRLYL